MAEEKKDEKKEETPKEDKKTEEAEEETVEVPTKFKKLVEEIEQMQVIDLAELVKILEKKFGVSSAPVAVAAPAGGAPADAVEEKSSFNVELTAIGEKKIDVIKAVRDITQKGLKESKDLVDAAASAPQMIKENAKKEEAEEIKKQFEAAGATVELK
ncbi:MAG: 50S ribosomal protein L7/L12 [Parcubacteria group bacterium]|nr:50S ribosomal protein L7/L12 [Parcubacteria group bacterium]